MWPSIASDATQGGDHGHEKGNQNREPARCQDFPEGPGGGDTGDGTGVRTTGRFLVIFKEEAAADRATIRSTMKRVAGVQNLATSDDYQGGAVSADMAKGEAVQFPRLGVVVMSGEEAMQTLSASVADTASPILSVEPEYIAYPSRLPDEAVSLRYLRGYRDAVNHLYDQILSEMVDREQEAGISAFFQDNAQFTWGLQATGVSTSSRNGQGIKVAVLDTGLDLQHPDFQGRQITSESFVAGITTAQRL